MDEFGICSFRPTPRSWIEFVREDESDQVLSKCGANQIKRGFVERNGQDAASTFARKALNCGMIRLL